MAKKLGSCLQTRPTKKDLKRKIYVLPNGEFCITTLWGTKNTIYEMMSEIENYIDRLARNDILQYSSTQIKKIFRFLTQVLIAGLQVQDEDGNAMINDPQAKKKLQAILNLISSIDKTEKLLEKK